MSVYLNHAATSVPKAPGVAAAVAAALDAVAGGSAGGGADPRGGCRRRLARLLGGAADRCVLAHGGTDALNAAAFGTLAPGDRAVVGVLEHAAVTRPLAELERRGVQLRTLDCTDDGFYRPDELEELLHDFAPVTLVALSHGSNVAGTVQPVEELAAVARDWTADHGGLFLVDACQTAGHVAVRADGWGVDLLATGGHKGLLGPPGTGALLLSDRAAPLLRPTRFGGTGGGGDVGGVGGGTGGDDTPPGLPHRLEPGTPNLPALAGLAVALDWVDRTGVGELHRRGVERTGDLLDRLFAVPGVRVLGTPDAERRCGLVTFALAGWDPAEAAGVLHASFGIDCRAGLHCAPGAHRRFGTASAGRGGAVLRRPVHDPRGRRRRRRRRRGPHGVNLTA